MDWIAPLEKEAAHDTLEIAFGEFANPSPADPNRPISASKNRPGIFWLLCFCFVSSLWPLGHLAAAPNGLDQPSTPHSQFAGSRFREPEGLRNDSIRK
jgi:hypothetical protein